MGLRQLHKTSKLTFYTVDTSTELEIPLVSTGISAGFPSPADDFLDPSIDLNKAVIKNKDATFFIRVNGVSMKDAGIDDGDLLVVDKSLSPQNDKIAVCYIDGEFTVKRLKVEKNCVYLVPENKDYKPIKVTEDNDLIIWGIVTTVIKSV